MVSVTSLANITAILQCMHDKGFNVTMQEYDEMLFTYISEQQEQYNKQCWWALDECTADYGVYQYFADEALYEQHVLNEFHPPFDTPMVWSGGQIKENIPAGKDCDGEQCQLCIQTTTIAASPFLARAAGQFENSDPIEVDIMYWSHQCAVNDVGNSKEMKGQIHKRDEMF